MESWFKYLKDLPQNIKYLFQRPQLGSKQQRGKLLFCFFCVEPYSSSRVGESGSSVCHVKIGLMKNVQPQERTFYARIVTQMMNTFKF